MNYWGLFAQSPTIYIKMNLADCASCTGYLKTVPRLLNNENSFCVYPLEDSLYSNEILESYSGLSALPNIIYSDSIINKLTKYPFSSLHVVKSGIEVFHCNIKEVGRSYNNIVNLFFTDSVLIKGRIPSNNEWDYSSNTFCFLDNKNKSISTIEDFPLNTTISKIKITDQFSRHNLKSNLTEIRYNKSLEIERSLRLSNPSKVVSFFMDKDTILAMFTNDIYFDTLFGTKMDTGILQAFSVLKLHHGNLIAIYPFGGNIQIGDYRLAQRDFFYRDRNFYALILHQNSELKDRNFLSNFEEKNQKLNFKRIYPFKIPEIHAKQNIGNNFMSFVLRYPFLINQISNEIYNLEDSSTHKLPINLGNPDFTNIKNFNVRIERLIWDMEIDDNFIHILSSFKNEYFLSKINRKTLKLVSENRVIKSFDKLDLLGSPKICNNNEIWYLVKGNNYLYREKF
jgi:hypothetical protein